MPAAFEHGVAVMLDQEPRLFFDVGNNFDFVKVGAEQRVQARDFRRCGQQVAQLRGRKKDVFGVHLWQFFLEKRPELSGQGVLYQRAVQPAAKPQDANILGLSTGGIEPDLVPFWHRNACLFQSLRLLLEKRAKAHRRLFGRADEQCQLHEAAFCGLPTLLWPHHGRSRPRYVLIFSGAAGSSMS